MLFFVFFLLLFTRRSLRTLWEDGGLDRPGVDDVRLGLEALDVGVVGALLGALGEEVAEALADAKVGAGAVGTDDPEALGVGEVLGEVDLDAELGQVGGGGAKLLGGGGEPVDEEGQ